MAMILQEVENNFLHINSIKKGLNDFLSNDNLHKLQGIMRFKKVSAGTHLFWEGEEVDKMYYIQSGRIKLKMSNEGGKELLLSINQEGSLLGEFGGFDEELHYTYRAEVTEDAKVGMILVNDLKKLMYQFGNFAVEFMSWLSWSHRVIQKKLYDFIIFDKAGALASTLLQLTTSFGVKCEDGIFIGIELTNKEYADFIGTSRESVNRQLNAWKKEGIIDIVNRQILIRRIDKLSSICDCA